jgi:hypothetical protein
VANQLKQVQAGPFPGLCAKIPALRNLPESLRQIKNADNEPAGHGILAANMDIHISIISEFF